MTVKDQVTVAVQAVELTGPLPTPQVLVSVGCTGDEIELVVLVAGRNGMREVTRSGVPRRPLTAYMADLWCSLVADRVYDQLCITWGVQGALEDLPTAAGPPVA